ncbi:hypothetical protein SEMRO_607_G174680.1 [Seminavis robusta]|uniref:Uncharacterized protein n=1 Tax=Seminavis robusta TaxID=568900 RepID=A0A9N8E6P9_9STRA|nr:hypothetical protein SEMRO_607_G174680.1 [Seminavis robusta]|eukprot:Sro607_g174680.1 n/a (239) ;mRNA; r:37686-38402
MSCNFECELAGCLYLPGILIQELSRSIYRGCTITILCDNAATAAWQDKQCPTSPSSATSYLKQLNDIQHHYWQIWQTSVASIPSLDPHPNGLAPCQQLSLLKVFATRVRCGRLTASGQPVRAARVQDYGRAVAQEIRLGSHLRKDPRLDEHNTTHIELANISRGYSKADPPPDKTKPIPLQLLRHAITCILSTSSRDQTIRNMLLMGWFFLLRPGEYTYSAPINTPFRLKDVTFLTPT